MTPATDRSLPIFDDSASARETVADAVDEWLHYVEFDRQRKASTLRDYRHMADRIKREIGGLTTGRVTLESVERYRDDLVATGLSNRTVNKYLVVLHGIFKRAERRLSLPANPVALVERRPTRKRLNIEVFSRDEVMALIRASASEQDGAIFLTAAFTGLRMGELLALRWRDVDFARHSIHVRQSISAGVVGTPKSGVERSVPLADEVARALIALGRRDEFTAPDDLVFHGRFGHLHAGRLRERYKKALTRAGLRSLRFHELRHTFGTHAIQAADSREVMEWMGHADIRTTQIYLHFKSHSDAAQRISLAFKAG